MDGLGLSRGWDATPFSLDIGSSDEVRQVQSVNCRIGRDKDMRRCVEESCKKVFTGIKLFIVSVCACVRV